MTKTAIRFFASLLLINTLSAAPAWAANELTLTTDNSLLNISLEDSFANVSNAFSVKSGQPYNQDNDPAFMKSGPADETPQHGYFAVPLIIIGLAGILLYFSRMKD